jgi:hypothetical protein
MMINSNHILAYPLLKSVKHGSQRFFVVESINLGAGLSEVIGLCTPN